MRPSANGNVLSRMAITVAEWSIAQPFVILYILKYQTVCQSVCLPSYLVVDEQMSHLCQDISSSIIHRMPES